LAAKLTLITEITKRHLRNFSPNFLEYPEYFVLLYANVNKYEQKKTLGPDE